MPSQTTERAFETYVEEILLTRFESRVATRPMSNRRNTAPPSPGKIGLRRTGPAAASTMLAD
jgi:hypothetical protein